MEIFQFLTFILKLKSKKWKEAIRGGALVCEFQTTVYFKSQYKFLHELEAFGNCYGGINISDKIARNVEA